MRMPESLRGGVAKELGRGALLAGALVTGVAIAGACTQIDATTKLVTYYQRYTELRAQMEEYRQLVEETVSDIQNIVPNIQGQLDQMEQQLVGDVEQRLGGLADQYGIDVQKAAVLADAGDLAEYAGRNVLGDNDPCLAASLGLGRDVPPAERVVSECQGYLEERMVGSDPLGGSDMAPNAALPMQDMLAISGGDWPAANAKREDLAWSQNTLWESGDASFTSGTTGSGSLKDASPDEVASGITSAMRVGNLLTGHGSGSVLVKGNAGSGWSSVNDMQRQAQVARNAHAVEAVAREASVRPRLEQLRAQLDAIDPAKLDGMTEGQRYAARLEAQATVQQINLLLQASRRRQEQLMGAWRAIGLDSEQDAVIGGAS